MRISLPGCGTGESHNLCACGGGDIPALLPLLKALWPHETEEELSRTLSGYTGSGERAVFAEKRSGRLIGAALCCLRHDYVEGCETSPVGYLEGLFVEEAWRRQGIGRRLTAACEDWAREKGCSEFASDCELENAASLAFHLGSGFREENRIICFRKTLTERPEERG